MVSIILHTMEQKHSTKLIVHSFVTYLSFFGNNFCPGVATSRRACKPVAQAVHSCSMDPTSAHHVGNLPFSVPFWRYRDLKHVLVASIIERVQ